MLVYNFYMMAHNYGRTPLTQINWDGKPSGYAENQDNWICL